MNFLFIVVLGNHLISCWTPAQVQIWLDSSPILVQYKQNFQDNEISGKVLQSMKVEVLGQMKIKIKDQHEIYELIKPLQGIIYLNLNKTNLQTN
jgi:SAM domain (Sterile alpha motif)